MPKTRKKIPLMKSFMLTGEDKDNLEAAAEARDVSQSSVIRTALRDLFENDGLTVTETE